MDTSAMLQWWNLPNSSFVNTASGPHRVYQYQHDTLSSILSFVSLGKHQTPDLQYLKDVYQAKENKNLSQTKISLKTNRFKYLEQTSVLLNVSCKVAFMGKVSVTFSLCWLFSLTKHLFKLQLLSIVCVNTKSLKF